MTRVLIISYYWPPCGGVVILRPLSLARYLRDHGFKPIIICSGGNSPWLFMDEHIETPSVEVHRVDSGDLNALFDSRKTPLSIRIRTALRATFRTDYMAKWADRATEKAKEIIEEKGIELVIATSPPFSVQRVGYELKREFRDIKYIADLQDLFYSFRRGNPILGLRRMLAIPRTIKHIRSADLVITASSGFSLGLKDLGIDSRAVSIGFDCKIATPDDYKRGDLFRMLHTGSFPSTGQTAEYVISAFLEAQKKDKDFREKARLIFAGGNPRNKIGEIALDCYSGIDYLGELTHSKAIDLQRSIDVNLLILTIPDDVGGKSIIPGKMFEYIASLRPVLSTVPEDGEAARIARKNNLGPVVGANNIRAISNAMLDLFQSWKTGKLDWGATRDRAEFYRSRNRIAEFAKAMKELL